SLIFVPRSIFPLGAKALETCPRLNQGPVDREIIVAHQLGFSRLSDHGVEKQSPHFVLHQPITILANHRGIEALFLKLHVQKPAKQQIVAHCSHNCRSLLTEYSAMSNSDFNILSGAIDGRPTCEYIRLNTPDSRLSS